MNLSLPHGPRRIVCLTEEPTEILYALGEQDRIVGISAYTVRPPEVVGSKPVVSAFIGGSVDKICALKPDLILGFSDIQAKLASELISANQQVLIFNQRSIPEILDVIVQIGLLVDCGDAARDLVASYVTNLEAAQDRAAQRGRGPRVYFEEWDDPMISGIQWVSELIEVVGGQDVFSEKSRGKLAKERFVSVEEVRQADPEVLLACWCGKDFELAPTQQRLQGVSALTTGRVYEIPPEQILQPGPACLTDGLASIEAAIWEGSP
ncbi:MAG: ABC transporter substrate-binding protein [Rhodobacterales bacterium]|nr:ABC transporter substrate-binding protein [Rhodobacterales bacterium]